MSKKDSVVGAGRSSASGGRYKVYLQWRVQDLKEGGANATSTAIVVSQAYQTKVQGR